MLSRRHFLRITTAAALSGGAVGVAHAAPRRVRLTLHSARSPSGEGWRIAHLTDLHVGWGTPRRLLEQAVKLAQVTRPDLVVLTGDYLNRNLERLDELGELVARLPRPCVATLGNHDHWAGAAAIARTLERSGAIVLRNASHRVTRRSRRLTLIGVDDGFTHHDDVDAARARAGDPARALALCHFPSTADALAARGARLVLAGHTHGGQLRIPIVMPAVLRMTGSRYIAGWYRAGAEEKTHLFVNAGVGSSVIRCRVGQRALPEVALIELT